MNYHYKKNVGFLVRDYNKLFPLPYYFHDMLYNKGDYKIADLGAGPVCTLGGKKAGSKITIYASDINAKEYKGYTDAIGQELLIPIEYQDMENLTYPDEMFDVVHCVNALDHTKDVRKALSEMKRVCKKGGVVYLRHSHNQKDFLHGEHYWNVTEKGFDNGETLIELDDFKTGTDGFQIINIMKKI